MIDRLAPIRYLLNCKKEFLPGVEEPFLPERMGWDCKQYQVYADACIDGTDGISLRTEKIIDPIKYYDEGEDRIGYPKTIPQWVKDDREGYGITAPYYFFAGGVRQLIGKPPFLITAEVPIIYPYGVIPSVWLHNDLHYEPVTKELDLVETDKENGLWFAYHYGGKNYQDRKINNSVWWLGRPIGRHTIHLELSERKAVWYLDGRKIKTIKDDFRLNFWLLATLIVTTPHAEEVTWENLKIRITR